VQAEESSEDEIDRPVLPTLCNGKNLNGTDCKNKVSVAGEYCPRHAEVEANKTKMKDFCCHCLENVSPVVFEDSADLAEDLVLNCGHCNLKNHPACLGIWLMFNSIELSTGIVSKILAYGMSCNPSPLSQTGIAPIASSASVVTILAKRARCYFAIRAIGYSFLSPTSRASTRIVCSRLLNLYQRGTGHGMRLVNTLQFYLL
jgi:hypothetical protein